VRTIKLWRKLLGVEHIVFEGWEVVTEPGGEEVLVFAVRPDRSAVRKTGGTSISGCPTLLPCAILGFTASVKPQA
jgi:hypothetical protein